MVHLNIPCPKIQEVNSWIKEYILNPLLSFAKHHLPLFICALLVPEYVLAWSIRQFITAQKIARENKGEFVWIKFLSIAIILSNSLLERQWLMTHRFFIIMGGFHILECNSKKMSNDN